MCLNFATVIEVVITLIIHRRTTIIAVWVIGVILTYSAGILVHLFLACILPKCFYGI